MDGDIERELVRVAVRYERLAVVRNTALEALYAIRRMNWERGLWGASMENTHGRGTLRS